MSTHFCKVGKIKPNLNKLTSLKEFEKIISDFGKSISKVDDPNNINSTTN
jgi:hypothetical protein